VSSSFTLAPAPNVAPPSSDVAMRMSQSPLVEPLEYAT
jgi:hypothetical protein